MAHCGTTMARHCGTIMALTGHFKGFDIEEDNNKFRQFMQSEQFKAACKALRKYEGQAEGLTPAEVWHEVDMILADLKTLEAEDRDTYMQQVLMSELRRLKQMEREGNKKVRTDVEVRRSLTCIFYCLALRLERTSRNQLANPHNELIDAIVTMLVEMRDPVLPLLYKCINDEGDRREAKSGQEMDELNPLAEDEDWASQWRKVANHYADRLYDSVKTEHRVEYNSVWTALEGDVRVSAIMQKSSPLKGDEHKELGINYNAKAMFNVLGLMYQRGFFSGFGGLDPFAAKATEHYDKDTKNMVRAKREYFNPEGVNTNQRFVGLTADELDYLKKLISLK